MYTDTERQAATGPVLQKYAKNVKGCWQPTQLERGKERFLLMGFRRSMVLLRAGGQTFRLQN